MSRNVWAEGANEICSIILNEIKSGPRDFFLYAEVDDGVIAPSMVQEYPDHIFWAPPPWDICDVLHRMWQSAEENAKWWALTLEIHGDKFELQFNYDTAVRFDEGTDERSKAAIAARYPNLPMRVPRFDPEAEKLKMLRRSMGQAASFELTAQKGPDSDEDS